MNAVLRAVTFAFTFLVIHVTDGRLASPAQFSGSRPNVDTPDDDPDTELVAELRNKRLGLSDTVYAQIRRYSDAVKRSQRTVRDEAVALARLIGRRPDAEAVFRAAGRFLANEAYQGISPMTRRIMLTLPSLIARPIALRHASRIVTRYFNGSVSRVGSSVVLDVPASVTIDSAPKSIGCAYYEAGLAELLRSPHQRRGRCRPCAMHCAWRRLLQLARRVAPTYLNSTLACSTIACFRAFNAPLPTLVSTAG